MAGDTQSLIYRSPRIYNLTMRLMYGRHFHARYRAIAGEIEAGSSVLDVCCGDHRLLGYLGDTVSYTGADLSESFIEHGRRRGVEILRRNVLEDSLPEADVVVMQGSLYQFIPRHEELVDRLLAACRKKVLISEPVRNLSSSPNPLIRFLAKRSANPGTGDATERFDETSFTQFLTAKFESNPPRFETIDGGREVLAILERR